MRSFCIKSIGMVVCMLTMTTATMALEPTDPESAIRKMIRANADKDLPTLSQLLAHDADIISYAIAGRKYIGWTELEQGLLEEFRNAQKLEIPIKALKVWTKDDLAWYAMELDYIRYVADGERVTRTELPMQETGVLERRNGRWQLLSWHESLRSPQLRESFPAASSPPSEHPTTAPRLSTTPHNKGK